MRHSMNFNFDGISSRDMGISKINRSGSLFDDQLVSEKIIIEEKIEGRDSPYFYGVEYSPISFPLSIYFDENLSNEKTREVLRWLNQDTYKPFYMEDAPERIWYVMIINDISSIHNGIRSGYMELELRTDSSRTKTPYVLSDVYRLRGNANGTIIDLINKGDFDCYPHIHIKKSGDGNLAISNLSNDSGEMTIKNLKDEEEVYIDCENKEIESTETHRYDDLEGKYLILRRGFNRIKIVGNCNIQFETEFSVY